MARSSLGYVVQQVGGLKMFGSLPTDDDLRKKAARKARPGGRPKWINIPRNWVHQALSYMDSGELSFRIAIQSVETLLLWYGIDMLWPGAPVYVTVFMAFVLIHTWNWVTNGLFWAVIIFTFPRLKNPGVAKTVEYLNAMRARCASSRCISGIAIYGSVTRRKWHDRSDIDIRLLRRKGILNLICAGLMTMRERWLALLARQPMDLYLADDVDFLNKMRSDEVPVLLLAKDERLHAIYPGNDERTLTVEDLVGGAVDEPKSGAGS